MTAHIVSDTTRVSADGVVTQGEQHRGGLPTNPTRLWVCTDHASFWPVGCASIVMADDEQEAVDLLKLALKDAGLNAEAPFTLVEINMSLPFARVLNDGDY